MVYDIDETNPFVADGTLGDLTDPEILNISADSDEPADGCTDLSENTIFFRFPQNIFLKISNLPIGFRN